MFDAAQDRLAGRFYEQVESIRAGWIFAHDDKQHRSWSMSHGRRARSAALTGGALEKHYAELAFARPDLVKHAAA